MMHLTKMAKACLVVMLMLMLFSPALADPGTFPNGTPPEEVWADTFDTGDLQLLNTQVTIEVRFITVDDQFFERIGVDFDFDVNPSTTPIGPVVVPNGVNFQPSSFSGVPANPFSSPFSIRGSAQPAQFGFAILSDIEAFFFLQAARGDRRTNILQAPQVTLFNGQVANIASPDTKTRFRNLIVKKGAGLTVKPLVSDNEQWVRLDLLPVLHSLGISPYQNPPQGNRDRERGDRDSNVEQPNFQHVQISTTVAVPDGGTILLGGIKPLAESRKQLPILSRIPYITRLFHNSRRPQSSKSLMMMVTPRIIIQEEEEQ